MLDTGARYRCSILVLDGNQDLGFEIDADHNEAGIDQVMVVLNKIS